MRLVGFLLIINQTVYCVVAHMLSDCVTPPLECPNVNITFWLYTRANREDPFEVRAFNSTSIASAPWVKGAPVKILLHGYTGHKNFSPSTEIRPAYLECCDYNIISVDYNKIALEPCYLQASRNTQLVGMCTAQLINELVEHHNFDLPQFHVIGFSLGGHAAGFVGNYITSGQLDRITALDPALPMFATADNDSKVDASDAKFVDVLHTNALQKGKMERCGHVDFFPNGGVQQPGCKDTENQTKSSCEHVRAPQYFAESIITKIGFYANKCASWVLYIIGWCQLFPSDDQILFGEYVLHNVSGAYFFDTNSKSPYAQGSKKSKNQ